MQICLMEKIEKLVDEYIDRIMEKQHFFKIMISEQVINKNPVIIQLISELKLKNAQTITRLIKDGEKKGAFKKNVDVIFMMGTLIGTITQVMISLDYYKEFNNLQSLSDDEFHNHVIQKLRNYIKPLIQSIIKL